MAMAFASLVRSSFDHAKLETVDAAGAIAVPGVISVITAKDLPGVGSEKCSAWSPLAVNVTSYRGEPIAIVVANDPKTAEFAARLIKVTCVEIPPVLDPLESLKIENPAALGMQGNILAERIVETGDCELSMKSAAVVVEREFRISVRPNALSRTHDVCAAHERGGAISISGVAGSPAEAAEIFGELLGTTAPKVKFAIECHAASSVPRAAILCGLAAILTKRSVTLVPSSGATLRRAPDFLRMKLGARRDGTITSIDVELILNAGAGFASASAYLDLLMAHLAGPYSIENVRLIGKAVATNAAPIQSAALFELMSIGFASETLMDELSVKLGIDPIELRIRNTLTSGIDQALHKKVLTHVRDESRWFENRGRKERVFSDGKVYGLGFAAGFRCAAPASTSGAIEDGASAQTEGAASLAACAEVAVDRATGEIALLRLVLGRSAGKLENRKAMESAVSGAGAFACGYALCEDAASIELGVLRPDCTDAPVPSPNETPFTVPIIAESESSVAPLVAECVDFSAAAVGPAIANAVYDAVGFRPTVLPILPAAIVAGAEVRR